MSSVTPALTLGSVYIYSFIWLCQVLLTSCRIFRCGSRTHQLHGLISSGFFTAEPSGNLPPPPHTHQESKQGSGLSAGLAGNGSSSGPGASGRARGQKCHLEEEAGRGLPRWHCVRALWRVPGGARAGGRQLWLQAPRCEQMLRAAFPHLLQKQDLWTQWTPRGPGALETSSWSDSPHSFRWPWPLGPR